MRLFSFWVSRPLVWDAWDSDIVADIPHVLSILRHIGLLRPDAVIPSSQQAVEAARRNSSDAASSAAAAVPEFVSSLSPGSGNRRFGAHTCASIPMNEPLGDGPAFLFDVPKLRQAHDRS
jgi:hypothetical protein